jgi:hypothetical protein
MKSLGYKLSDLVDDVWRGIRKSQVDIDTLHLVSQNIWDRIDAEGFESMSDLEAQVIDGLN